MQRVTVRNPPQSEWAERKSGENFSRNRRKPQPFENFSNQFRGHENDEELEQQQLFGAGCSHDGSLNHLIAGYGKGEAGARKLGIEKKVGSSLRKPFTTEDTEGHRGNY